MSALIRPARLEIVGRPASPGLARGPVHILEETTVRDVHAGTSAQERTRLLEAIAAAAAEVADLIAGVDDEEAAAILEFQLAMLEDDALIADALPVIDGGAPALVAFQDAMADVAAGYRTGDDEYFQARASDIEDLAERVIAHLTGAETGAIELPPGGILLARDLTPSRFLSTDWSGGRAIALFEGSPTAHVAILARSRGVPMAVGFGTLKITGHAAALLDGETGRLVLSPDADDEAGHHALTASADEIRTVEQRLARRQAVTADGTPIKVMINAGDPGELDALDPALCDGIGLVRTEFLFHGRRGLPTEDDQLAAYRRILTWAEGRPVTFRTLDAGGDKPIAGLTREESNPFLGLRGIRLSLARPDVFRVQVRALLRAAAEGEMLVMAPMVALPAEMQAVTDLFVEEAAALRRAGLAHAIPPLGMMVEVPAVALTLDLFDVDFVSIGSNDLTQYVMAASRDATGLAGLDDAGVEAVQRMIRMVVSSGAELGVPVSLCGDAGSDTRVLPKLLAAGLRSISVAPAQVGRVKRVIADWRADGGPDG
ncbi:phosphoenolpyruvate--protein phosphotransferase [Chthonobacter albigriseus]|uniref:phosphoenolpyruvate--protein phosphotransferase n=1 Tax=Chthonobacter albigriseus TaxID=1683161 RepID=UPI0015EEABD3|nr:putative PEP-binding protein [Chthonobacter albigriseus]